MEELEVWRQDEERLSEGSRKLSVSVTLTHEAGHTRKPKSGANS